MKRQTRVFFVLLISITFSSLLAAQTVSSDTVVYKWVQSQGISITSGNRVKLLKSGVEKFDEMFRDIRNAKYAIDLEYFNFRNDSIANVLFNLLAVKAKQGVRVRALYDAFGNMSNNRPLKHKHEKAIRKRGIQLYKWDPITFPWVNHVFPRDHRKIVVIDYNIAYTGGMNVADYYLVGLPKIGPWRDMHMRIEGEASKELQKIFNDGWYKQTRKKHTDIEEVSRVLNHQDSLLLQLTGNKDEWEQALVVADSLLKQDVEEEDGYHAGHLNVAESDDGTVITTHKQAASKYHTANIAILNRVPRKTPKIMRDFYATALDAAQESVYIINPYFSPTPKVRKAIERAIKRGIEVNIMIPTKSDIPITPDAAYRRVNKLRKKGATVYLYDAGFHHSKILMVDGKFCTVGSTNLDSRSLRYDYEENAVVFDKAVTDELVQMFKTDIKDSRLLTDEIWKKRSGWRKFVGWAASLISWVL
ncbi:MAG: phospholipase D-like domain-containing protein [Bacteroidaceae bacterium]|nr:phospholipase D-like domain-containing protein [Bacteroidaceae bacterium]